MITGVVTNIQYFTMFDGPGVRTTVFLKGCRLNCRWCHNPEGVRHYPEVFHLWSKCNDCGQCDDICPTGALQVVECLEQDVTGAAPGSISVKIRDKMVRKIRIDKGLCLGCRQCVEVCIQAAFVISGEIMTVAEVIEKVAQERLMYENSDGGGLTLSGGEPTAQPEFCLALLKAAKEKGINTALDTCGYVRWDILNEMLNYTDVVLFDLKNMDHKVHKEFTGVSNDLIRENARRIIARGGVEMRVRVPVIPEINDSAENMQKTAQFISALGLIEVDILPFHPWAGQSYRLLGLDYPFTVGEWYPVEKQEAIEEIFRANGLKPNRLGG
ncbi:glycyl-radical enzyme activating protein [Desulfosporosinus sp. BICA1-9]|uniref:glycyl-radical enzyme activating protein n=1 Tax=Desulfosporosinus sp. BICA1-9 TaxID=1531958 RepID=UPI000A471ABA|nr:glycyl-radical enzyme activating protein [Desulfosporosinus sp. BICA1-9]HBW37691.1 glycyl-radical enzyme activating protein [Desulfosporosinus sp.]